VLEYGETEVGKDEDEDEKRAPLERTKWARVCWKRGSLNLLVEWKSHFRTDLRKEHPSCS